MRAESLISLALALAVSAVLVAGKVPSGTGQARLRAAVKAAGEMRALLAAARNFRLEHKRWPGSPEELKQEGWLPQNWNGVSPWGTAYAFFAPNEHYATVSVDARSDAEVLSRLVPGASVSGSTVTAAVPANPREKAGEDLILKAGEESRRRMKDELFGGGNRAGELSHAAQDSDAVPLEQAEQRYVNLSGDVMTGELHVHGEVHGNTFVDRDDPSYYLDPSGTGRLETPSARDVYVRALGLWASQIRNGPARWGCYRAVGWRAVCCAPGYKILTNITSYNKGDCSHGSPDCREARTWFYQSGGRFCMYNSQGWRIELVCCR